MNDDRSLPPDDDLESRLRDHYRDAGGDSAGDFLLTARIDRAMDRPPARAQAKLDRKPRTRGAFGFRAFAGVVGVVAAFTAIAMIANLLLSGSPTTAGPGPTGTPGAASSLTPEPTSSPAIEITATPDPSGHLAGAIATSLGRMRNGGVWWAGPGWFGYAPDSGSSTWSSASWPISDTQPPATYVLDDHHWWTVKAGPGSGNAYADQGLPYDHLHPVVNRLAPNSSADWLKATVPGDYPDTVAGISFLDASTGFLMFSDGRSGATSTILRSNDAGKTWSVVATIGPNGSYPGGANLGGMFTASDASTLWAGAQAEAGGHGHPLLAVSRDGGITWSEVKLPGLSGLVGGFDTALLEPPVFLDPKDGFVNVVGPNERVYMTADAGRTWVFKDVPVGGAPVDFDDANNWVVPDGSTVESTADGGKTWQAAQGQGVPPGQFTKLAFMDAEHGYGLFQPWFDKNTYLYRTEDGGGTWVLQSSAR